MNSLTLNLTKLGDSSSFLPYWINLEQLLPEELATHAEASDLIDELFSLDPCSGEPPPEEPETAEEEQIDWDKKIEEARKKWEKILAGLRGEFCEDDDGTFEAIVKVTRSHQDKLYTLLLHGSEELQTTVGHVEAVVEVVSVKKATSVSSSDILVPADQSVTAEWQGKCFGAFDVLEINPEITIENGRIFWSGKVTGSLKISFAQPYDLVTIKAISEDATVTAIGYRAVDEIDLQEPPEETDPQAEELCWRTGPVTVPNPDGDCFIKIIHDVLCRCSKSDSGQSTEFLRDAACKPGFDQGGIVDVQTTTSFVDCDESDNVNDPEYYEEVCCYPPSIGLPLCKNLYFTWSGRGITPERKKELESMYDGNVSIITCGPKENPCGIFVISQDIDPLNCCEDVEPLVIDAAGTSPTIGYPGSAAVAAKGGEPPYYWETSGGYEFANGHGSDISYAKPPRNTIFTKEGGTCGDATTNLHDDCSSVSFFTEQTADALQPGLPEGLTMAEDTEMMVVLTPASVGPYKWSAGGDLSWEWGETDGPSNILISSPNFCGMGSISVEDACENSDTKQVKSTNGEWVFQDPEDYNACGPPGTIFPNPTPSVRVATGLISSDGEWKMDGTVELSGFQVDCTTPEVFVCPKGTKIFESTWIEDVACTGEQCGMDVGTSNGCCDYWIAGGDCGGDETHNYRAYAQVATQLWRWECIEA